jgi:hypothetical protein
MSQILRRSIFAVLLTIGMTGDLVQAQTASRDVQLATARELIQMGREEAINEEMHFTADQSVAFWPLYKEYRAELAVVQDRQMAMVVDYMGNYYDYKLTDADAERIIKDYFKIQKDILHIREQYVRKFRKILSAANVMRLYQLENKIEAEVNVALAQTVPLMESE